MPDLTPAEELRAAAKAMRERAQAATAGPWERPLDVRDKAVVAAALPLDEDPRSWEGGTIPARFASHGGYIGRWAGQRERTVVVSCPTDSLGGHLRKRCGRDLEYVASMHPGVALAVADWLDRFSDPVYCYGPVEYDAALAVARAYLGTQEATDA